MVQINIRHWRISFTCVLIIFTSLSIGQSRAQSPCPAAPNPPDTCPLPGGIECFCCGIRDTDLAPAGPTWGLSFIDAGNKCDPDGQDGGLSGADGTDPADFDGDGDLDVVTGFEEGGGLQLFLNPCNPSPSALQDGCTTAGQVMAEWSKVQVDGGVSIVSIEDASFGDLDGDCLPDAVISSMEGDTDKICIHYYVGPAPVAGRRQSADLLNVNNWRGECLTGGKNYMRARVGQIYPRTQTAADNLPNSCSAVNPPGCNDIVVGAKVSASNNDEEMLFWYECPGNSGTDPGAAGAWVRHLIGYGDFFMSIELVDMDLDRDLDVLYSDRQRVGWFENPYDSPNPPGPDFAGLVRVRGEWPRHVIEGPGAGPGEPTPYPESPDSRWLTQYNLDNDGDIDIITTVVYDMRDCPNNSTFCTGSSHDNPGIRIVAHWYERRILYSTVRPTEGVSFALGSNLWLNYLRHVVAANDLPFRDEDTPEPPDEWVSKAVAAGDVMGTVHPELVFSSRGSGHGIYALLSTNPRFDNVTFERNHTGATQPLVGQIWTAQKISSAYVNLPDLSPAFDGRKMKYDNIQLVDLDHNGSLDVLSSEENAGSDSRGLGTVWYRNPCGNGLVDAALGEQCDLGGLNGNADQCCTNKCTFRANGTCRPAANACDAPEYCLAGSGSCPSDVKAPAGTPCGALESCNDVCNGAGVCLIGGGEGCPDDENPCTDDLCQGGVCTHPPRADGLACPGDDGNVCTQHQCVSGVCTAVPTPGAPCADDGNECRQDLCDAAGLCTHPLAPNGTACTSEGVDCAAGQCQNGWCDLEPAAQGTPCPDDGNECTVDVCNGAAFGCSHGPVTEGTPCGDNPDPNNPCELQNRCSSQFGGICLQLTNAGQVCRPAVGECDQVEACTLPSQSGGISVCPPDGFRTGLPCSDEGNLCTLNVCDSQGVCTHPPETNGFLCPGGVCTLNTCQGGVCTHEPTPGEPCAPDSNYCTAEVCNAQGECGSVPVANGTLCFVLDWDNSLCTDDVCIDGTCEHPPKPTGTPCGRVLDEICSDPDSCDDAGQCSENDEPDDSPCVSDGQSCTRDICRDGACTHIPIDSALLPNGLCGFEFSPIGSGIAVTAGDLRNVEDFAVFDDGGGADLYAAMGGAHTGLNSVVRWNGAGWPAVGGGIDANVRALAVFDDGNGPALFAAGLFPLSPFPNKFSIAKWNGGTWTNVDPGFCPDSTAIDGCVNAMAVFDDGNGPALYVGGSFSAIGQSTVNHVVKWDGNAWTSVGNLSHGFGGNVQELAVVDPGSGPKLYACGMFDHAGGSLASGIAYLDFADWIPMGTLGGVVGDPVVHAIAGFNGGGGPELYIGGNFSVDENADGMGDGFGIARWTGSEWSAVGLLVPAYGTVFDLFPFDDGTGSALYAGGLFDGLDTIASPFVARYRNSVWESLNQCLSGFVSAFAAYDVGGGNALIIGGLFDDVGGPEGDRVVRWGCTGDNDCNDNLTPDNEEPDCDNSGTPDDCDLLAGGIDCQPNGILDSCELAIQDENENGVPDDCDTFHQGDWNADCSVDLEDVWGFHKCLRGPGVSVGSMCRFVFDSDQDDDVDLADWAAFQRLFSVFPAGCPQ